MTDTASRTSPAAASGSGAVTHTAEPEETAASRTTGARPGDPLPRRAVRRRARRLATGHTPTDRVARALLAVLGLVLVASGIVGLLLAHDVLHWLQPASIYRDGARNATAHPEAGAAVASAAGVLLALAALGMLWQLLAVRRRTPKLATTPLPAHGPGRTTAEPAKLAKAVAADMQQLPEIDAASARIFALGGKPRLEATVTASVEVNLEELLRQLEGPLERLRRSVGAEALYTDLRLNFTSQPTRRRKLE